MKYGTTERTSRDAREHLADVVADAIAGTITYITSNGRRMAAVVPLAVADDLIKKTEEN